MGVTREGEKDTTTEVARAEKVLTEVAEDTLVIVAAVIEMITSMITKVSYN